MKNKKNEIEKTKVNEKQNSLKVSDLDKQHSRLKRNLTDEDLTLEMPPFKRSKSSQLLDKMDSPPSLMLTYHWPVLAYTNKNRVQKFANGDYPTSPNNDTALTPITVSQGLMITYLWPVIPYLKRDEIDTNELRYELFLHNREDLSWPIAMLVEDIIGESLSMVDVKAVVHLGGNEGKILKKRKIDNEIKSIQSCNKKSKLESIIMKLKQ